MLVFGDDTRSFLAVARSLGRIGVAVHVSPFNHASVALSSRYISALHDFPDYSLDPSGWALRLETLLNEQKFDLIIPCDERAMLPLVDHSMALGNTPVALPGPKALDAFFDKHETRRIAAAQGVPTARGRLLSGDDNARRLLAEFGAPIAIKPRRSFHRDRLHSRASVRILSDDKAIDLYLREIAAQPERYLVEGFAPGDGVGVSVLAEAGRVLAAFQHRRLHESGPTAGSCLRISEAIDRTLLGHVERLSEAAVLNGVAMFEFRRNPESGRSVLLEVNARFWGSLPLAVKAGANFPPGYTS